MSPVSSARAVAPVQHLAAVVVAAAADQRQPAAEVVRLALPGRIAGSGRSAHFRSASWSRIGHAKRVRPLDHRRVVVRMGDRDRRQPALGRDALDDLVVEVCDAVPEHVAGVALDEQRALADREARRAADAEDAVVVADVGLVPVEQLVERQPGLAGVVRDVLTRVLADRAGAGRRIARRVLRAAGPTQVRRHQDRARAARRTRRAACAGTCRPGGRARGGSRSRRRAAWRRSRAWSGCTTRRRCFGAPISPRRFSALPARPARGGSTTTTSGSPARVAQIGQHLADVAGEERAVADRVQLLVLDRARDRLLADLDPPHRHRVAGHREADRADAAVEVVDGLVAGQPRVLARDRVELLRHLGVRLQERVRAHAEAQAADLLLDRILAPEQLGRQVRHLGDAAVDRPVDRLHLGELGQHLDQALAVEALAARGDELHEHLPGVPALAQHEVAQVALVRLLVVRRELLLLAPTRARGCARRCRRRRSASIARSRAPRPSGPPCAGRASARRRAA